MPLRNGMARPCQHQRQHVAGIVAGVGQQRHRMGEHAVSRLDGDQCDIQRRRQRKRRPECRGRMRMRVAMTVIMAMMMTMTMMTVRVVRVIGRHGSQILDRLR